MIWYAENAIGQTRVVKAIQREDQVFDWIIELAKMSLPGTPMLLAAVSGQRHLFLVETFIDGCSGSLFKTRASWYEKCCVASKLCTLLNRCHQSGVLHLDIKPEHILVDAFNEPYIIDFGTSRPLNPLKRLYSREVYSTPAYAAPECFHDHHLIGCATDVFSLALIFLDWFSSYEKCGSELYQTLLKATHFDPNIRFSDLDKLSHLFLNEVYGT